MKPNDKAYEAAKVECGRWTVNSSLDMTFRVIREEDGVRDKIAEFTNREERDEALERLRAEAMVNAAYAAQFPPSEDYAGVVKWLRDKAESLSEIYPPEADAADALETVLAERDALKAELAAANTRMSKLDFERTAAELDRDAIRAALAARLAPVDDEALVEIAAVAIRRNKFERTGRLDCFDPSNLTPEELGEGRNAIAAIRPHIEAAEREQCVKAVEKVAERINVAHHERSEWEDGYLQGVHDAAAAIRSVK